MEYFLALDGGGTHTSAVLADEARVLARASTGSVKLMRVDAAAATMRLSELVRGVLHKANVKREQVVRTCFGLSGVSIESVREWAQTTLREVVGGEIILCGDEEIALEAAFAGGAGVLAIAGTGSNVIGRCADGLVVSAGGWGPLLGDEGSGNWIGIEAIKAGLRAHDRNVTTCLLQEIEAHWGLQSHGELLGFANARPRPDFAELAEVVARCADGGDVLAIAVLQRAGEELAAQVSLVASKMHQAGCVARDASQIAFTGNVLAKISHVRDAMRVALPNMTLAQAAVDPLDGALWLARKTSNRAYSAS